jgi:hypothetical protein
MTQYNYTSDSSVRRETALDISKNMSSASCVRMETAHY